MFGSFEIDFIFEHSAVVEVLFVGNFGVIDYVVFMGFFVVFNFDGADGFG